jgi:dihydrofolate reductase
MSISLDGFVAGPDQSRDDPIGVGGLKLHEWHFQADEPGHEADVGPRDELLKPAGAYVMGRNMFGPIRGEWEGDWRGWWGEEPPYHAPVFVLTHHARESIEMEGGTTFHFVTAGFDAAMREAKAAAGDGDVQIAGGASTVRQALAAGALDELMLDVAPILLGSGERLLDGVTDVQFDPVDVIHSPLATHIRYRVGQ